jgi:glycosyltransferase involved in cell wall biosynthesis
LLVVTYTRDDGTQLRPEIMVVDDGSGDDSVMEAVAHFPWVSLIRQEPSGRSHARNRGAAATSAQYLLFLDADDLLRPDSLALMSAVLNAQSGVDMVVGRTIEFADTVHPPQQGARAAEQVVWVRLLGASLMRRALWDRVGAFDTSFASREAIDWMHRANQVGVVLHQLDDIVLERRLHGWNRTAVLKDEAGFMAMARAAIERKRGTQPR